jgi:hypothetical protein
LNRLQFSDDLILTRSFASVASNVFYLILEYGCSMLSVSALLRFLTLVNSSEEAGKPSQFLN